ncbi:hypothetical protein [Sulfurimonas sp.]|uniref:hypothetical protein n=1 Tax=Sulfurimonas sp. TaxID=2022749 RepID=UPI0025D7EFF7|nr:hypothetical protein [Sulfurimonas sp.]
MIGLEAGFSNLDYEQIDSGVTTKKETISLSHFGLKVGSEIDNYRTFLSTRVFDAPEFDYARTYGIEVQYMFHLSKDTDMFIGINAGTVDMEFNDQSSTNTVTLDSTYMGGDIGFNLHLSDGVDFEIGARIMSLNSSESESTSKYDFDNIVTGYASIIIKLPMEL